MSSEPRSAATVARDALKGPRRAAIVLLLAVVGTIVGGLVWASQAELDEVARGQGRVVPASEVQVAQNLEGGIVAEILVSAGQTVEAGQVLLRIDDTSADASLQELQETFWGLAAAIVRLTAEVMGQAPDFPADLVAARPDLVSKERQLYSVRQEELSSAIDALGQQADQKRGELAELEAQLASLEKQYALALEQYNLIKPLEKSGAVSKVEVLELERTLAEMQGEMNRIQASLPRARAAIGEAESRITEKRASFRAQAQADLNDRTVKLSALSEQMRGRADRKTRTEVRAPVKGVVKEVKVSSIGAVVKPGDSLVEIVPLDDQLLIEVQIRPADVAFIHVGLPARVRLTAYDYAIYGALEGEVEWISADTFIDDKGNSFYRAKVRTTETTVVGKHGEALPILPGMVAEVDILTARRTVLAYLLKPILRARELAFSER